MPHLQLQGHNIPDFLTGALPWLGLPSMPAAISLWVRSHLGSFLWSVRALELIENDVCGLNSSPSPRILLGSYVNQWMQTLWGWASILPSAKYGRPLLPPCSCCITHVTCSLHPPVALILSFGLIRERQVLIITIIIFIKCIRVPHLLYPLEKCLLAV